MTENFRLLRMRPDQPMAKTLFIGIGNRLRRDDAAGPEVARRLRMEMKMGTVPNAGHNVERDCPHFQSLEILEETGDGATLMEAWKNFDHVILCDAVSSGAKPGTIHHFDARKTKIPARLFRHSTHAFSAGEAIELARALNQLPSKVIVYGIEGKMFELGEGLSSEVEKAVSEVIQSVKRCWGQVSPIKDVSRSAPTDVNGAKPRA